MAKTNSITSTLTCAHTKVSEIHYTDNLPIVTGDNSRFYTGFCEDCNEMVYARTGKIRISWNYDRNKTFDDTLVLNVTNNK